MSDRKPLTQHQAATPARIADGADIYNRNIAETLRQIERARPDLIIICEPAAAPEDGAARQPYFGCLATAAGRTYLRDRGYRLGRKRVARRAS